MRLDEYLARRSIPRIDFARQAGLSPASITALCNDPAAWISRETAEKIAQLTQGAVTPNDFLGLSAGDESSALARVEEAVAAFAAGEILVVTDDDDREGEGDLIVAASLCTPEKMAFIIRHTSGIVCAPIALEEARRLRLDPMVAHNDAPHSTAFTVSVDYRHGTTTGISAEERTATCRALTNNNTGPADFVRPGHIFPLIAKEGGVLMRSGHTEAAVDLCRLAGQPPVGVICEMMNDDGTVTKGEQVEAFAKKHKLKKVTIADLIAYRQAREKLVERAAAFDVDSTIGKMKAYAYRTPFDQVFHFAFVYGAPGDGRNMPVRLHRANVIGDILTGGSVIQSALKKFQREGRGVLVYLREGTAGVPQAALNQPKANAESLREKQWREVGLGAQILRDLSIRSIRNLTSSSVSYVGLAGFGIELLGNEKLDG